MNRNFPRPQWRALAGAVGLITILLVASGCERIAPVRTLPSWVRGVYVPMVKNKSYEPGVEETATKLIQEAFLNDGRIDVVPKSSADLMLVVEITDWKGRTTHTTGEHVETQAGVTLTATAKLYEPFDLTKPLANLGTIKVNSLFNVDTRSTDYDLEPDRKHDILKALAKQVLFKTITGFPQDLRNLPPGTTLPEIRTPESIDIDTPFKASPNEDVQ